jgi:hypothetical protein
MAFVRFLAGVAVVVAIVVGIVTFIARASDGPLGPVAGGEFTSGERHTGPMPDWSFLTDRETVEFQLLEPARSRTTWILVHDGRLFIPCGYMNSTWGRLWKQWPLEAEQDGRALLRVDGTLYPVRLQRLESGPEVEPLVAEINRKYGAGATAAAVESGALWLFELEPRDA